MVWVLVCRLSKLFLRISMFKMFLKVCLWSKVPINILFSILKVCFVLSKGIPIKKSSTITPEKALHLSFLITDYWATAKKVIQSDLKMNDVKQKNNKEPNITNPNENLKAKRDNNPSILQYLHKLT